MIAYHCKLCNTWVIPGVSIDDLADHLLDVHSEKFPECAGIGYCSMNCLDHFQQLEGVKVYKIWGPEQYDRIYLVFARSEAEALERCRRGDTEFYHSPLQEHLWNNWKEVSGAYVWLDDDLNEDYEEVQAYECEYAGSPRSTRCEGHAGVPGI